METQATKSPHPLLWVAAIALIVFCGAGVGAMMGWIPTSMGKTDDAVLGDAAKPKASAPASASPAKAAPAKVAAPIVVAAAAKCIDCGVIQSVNEITTKGEGSGVGVVGGAVAGGLLGSQVGHGDGSKIATVIGAVGGAVAGNEIEKRVKTSTTYDVTVRMDDGTSRVINLTSAPSWRTGDKVRVVNGVIQSNA
jgi:outer membrane lipoprotein SlyB